MPSTNLILRGGPTLSFGKPITENERWKRELEFCERLISGTSKSENSPPSLSKYLVTQAAGAKHDGRIRVSDILTQAATFISLGDRESALSIMPGAVLEL